MSEEKEALKSASAEFKKYGTKLDRAIDAVLAVGVKEARFLPSGRKVVTVVGRLGDEFVDPDRPYCSCSNFFFRVVGGREEICYHLLSYEVAVRAGRVDIIEFSDDEYGPYFAAAVQDVFEVLRKSGS